MKNKTLKTREDLDALEKRLKELEDDPVMRIVKYNAATGDRAGAFYMGCRYIAAKREKDEFNKTVRQPFVSDEELR